jgi:hypothetical protein
MKIFSLLWLLFTISCSTDLSLKYRSASEYSLKENTFVLVVPNENKFFINAFQKTIVDDGWLKLVTGKEQSYYEIVFTNIKTEEMPINSSTGESAGKKTRSIVCRTQGSGSFMLKKNKEQSGPSFDFSAEGIKTSELELPKEHSQNSLWPLLNLMSGYNEAEQVSKSQNLNCMMDSFQDLNLKMAQVALSKIVPEVKKTKLILEDSKSDMEPLEEFIDTQNFDAAFVYLNGLLEKEKRSDIYYNLGVIQEARKKYPEACENYNKAFEINDKKLYSEQLAGCLGRKASYDKLK